MDKQALARMRELIPLIREADTAYYTHDRPIMTDREYDALYDELKMLEDTSGIVISGSPTQRTPGEVLEGLKEVAHTKPMLSAQKTKQVEDIIRWAEDIGLLNDEEYAKALVRHYQAKGYGIYKIKDELYRRQVPRDLWEEALAGLEEPSDTIRRFLEKKLTDPQDRKQVKKVSDALIRRGFTWGQVSAGMESFLRDFDDI